MAGRGPSPNPQASWSVDDGSPTVAGATAKELIQLVDGKGTVYAMPFAG
jgi:hypothetical protein